MKKIEYTSIESDIHAFKDMGESGWIYTHCPAMESKGRMVFYREAPTKKRTVASDRPEEPEDFIAFYKIYPQKKARPMALKMWLRLKPQERIDAMAGLKKHILYWKQKEVPTDKIPYPATYLNPKEGRRWEDSLDMSGIKTPEEIAEQEKRKIARERQEAEEKRKEEESAKELKAIIRKTAEIKEKQPDLYASIEEKARAGFDEKTQGGSFFKPILESRIRGIVRDEYL